jgi:hypothetical protein
MDTSDSINPFDRLVSGISSEERQLLLDKLKSSATDVESQTLESPESIAAKADIPLEMELQQKSLLYRFFLWIRSLFSGISSVDLYNNDKVEKMAIEISHTYAGLIDYSHEYLLTVFYKKLVELKICADFFQPYVAKIEEDPGGFYVFLGTLIAPEVTAQMNAEADPFIYPVTPEITKEHRTALLRKVDEILKNIPPAARKSLYDSVSSIEWLRQFTKLPFSHFIELFTSIIEDTYICTFASIDSELSTFARVLCSGRSITGEALEALFLFTKRGEKPEILSEFLDKAETQLSVMHIFITTVPIRSIACIVYDDSRWLPESFGGAEDWFIKYRDQWKKVFDQRWNVWVQACKKEEQRLALHEKFGLDSFPLLPYRPWTKMWGGLVFHYELTGGFLCWFFSNQYPAILRILKIILLEGIFTFDENKDELSTAVNDCSRVDLELKQFINRLAPSGETGLIFDKLSSEHLRTLQGQGKIASMIIAAEKEVKKFETDFCIICRLLMRVMNGFFPENTEKKYGPLKNLRMIRSTQNFYTEVLDTRSKLTNILDMFGQIETLDGNVQ